MNKAEEKAKYIDNRFKIAEKGIEYFNKIKGIHNVVGVDPQWLNVFCDAYEIGYNSISTENAQLKEAFKEMLDALVIIMDCEEPDESARVGYDAIAKAKKLLKNK